MESPLSPQFQILERIPGHIPRLGKSAGEELNWAYRLQDSSSNEIFIGMFCKPNHFTFLDLTTWERLKSDPYKDITWYHCAVGYIARTISKDDTCPYTYLHQFSINHYGNGKGQDSIDHRNQNKLDNRLANLRIVSQSVQNQNRGKVARHTSARTLPDDIKEPLPKFCVYYKEPTNKEKTKWREFFTIEGHPNQEGKRKATTKSNKVTILEKLEEAKKIIKELNATQLSLRPNNPETSSIPE